MADILTWDEFRQRLGLVPTDPSLNMQSTESANTNENCANTVKTRKMIMVDILIKNIDKPKNCVLEEHLSDGSIVKHEVVEIVHCRDCDSFIEETNTCTSFGSWTQADGYCHKAERRKHGSDN